MTTTYETVLVLGATGKTGRRIVEQLADRGHVVRAGSRAANPAFDWSQPGSWDACLAGATAVYISYSPDLAMPGATDAIQSLVEKAAAHGVKRLVLLSGRGEEEAQACERIVAGSGLEWTVVRASWFNQNFSEGAFADMVRHGEITLPATDIPEPFVDADDIADVAVAALTDPAHNGQIYELTGPEALTFAEAVAKIAIATGRPVTYTPVPHAAFIDGLAQSGAPQDVVWMLDYLFATVLDGRNVQTADGVQRALGREPRSFDAFCRAVAPPAWAVA
jgi:uncharacterized protein YbjT (DUF2867 family)